VRSCTYVSTLYVLQNSDIAVDHMEGMMPNRLIGLKANHYLQCRFPSTQQLELFWPAQSNALYTSLALENARMFG
jgi:hypothetical protein